MALTPAEKQRRYRERQSALMRSNPELVERELLEEAARCEQLSAEERFALANKIADLASHHLWHSKKLVEISQKVWPPGWSPPGFPP
jgi:hypothetical protein